MNNFDDLRTAVQEAKAQGDSTLILKGVSFQLYEGEPMQFNATLSGQRFSTVKFEERLPGRFTVAVAPEDGASIDYTQAKTFTMHEPLENLAAAFPGSEYIQQFLVYLINAK